MQHTLFVFLLAEPHGLAALCGLIWETVLIQVWLEWCVRHRAGAL